MPGRALAGIGGRIEKLLDVGSQLSIVGIGMRI
jgi:hypothetical protein